MPDQAQLFVFLLLRNQFDHTRRFSEGLRKFEGPDTLSQPLVVEKVDIFIELAINVVGYIEILHTSESWKAMKKENCPLARGFFPQSNQISGILGNSTNHWKLGGNVGGAWLS